MGSVGMLWGQSLAPELRKGNGSNSPTQGAFPGKGWDVGGFAGHFHGKQSAAYRCARGPKSWKPGEFAASLIAVRCD